MSIKKKNNNKKQQHNKTKTELKFSEYLFSSFAAWM